MSSRRAVRHVDVGEPLVGDVGELSDAPSSARAGEGALVAATERAAAMEQLASLAADALRVPIVFIALPGAPEERLIVLAGDEAPVWFAREESALWTSGLVELVSSAPLELRDLTRNQPAPQLATYAMLKLGSLIGAPIRSTSDHVYGVMCAAYARPTTWDADDVAMLRQFATMAASELELRRVVAEREREESRLEDRATRDELTGLLTRGAFMDRLQEALERSGGTVVADDSGSDDVIAIPSEELVAVVQVDVDGFGAVNERFGHRVGDRVLAAVGRRIAKAAGEESTVARLGGVRFAVLRERMRSSNDVNALAEALRSAVENPLTVGTEQISLRARVGSSCSATTAQLAAHLVFGAERSAHVQPVVVQPEPDVEQVQAVVASETPAVTSPHRVSAPPADSPATFRYSVRRPFDYPRRLWRLLADAVTKATMSTRVDTGIVRYRIEAVPLAPLLDRIRTIVVPQVYSRGVRYHPEVPANLAVRADAAKVQWILLELIGNALKFTRPGGVVRLECVVVDSTVQIRVLDGGPGFTPDALRHVFEPYFAVNRRHLRWTDRGIGLGLAIAHRLAEGMAGVLQAGRAPEGGGELTLTLMKV